VSVAFQRQAEGPREAEISKFDCLLVVADEDVARFDVSVHDPTRVAVKKGLHYLLQIVSSLVDFERISTMLNVLLQIGIEELKHEEQHVWAMDYLVQFDDSGVVHLQQKAHLAKSSAGKSLVGVLYLDFLQGNYL
jgi:hypothetical protein